MEREESEDRHERHQHDESYIKRAKRISEESEVIKQNEESEESPDEQTRGSDPWLCNTPQIKPANQAEHIGSFCGVWLALAAPKRRHVGR